MAINKTVTNPDTFIQGLVGLLDLPESFQQATYQADVITG